ncbi:MAG: clostripain-related cysteine peptidase [Candidatus Eremiobacterota bacterium]
MTITAPQAPPAAPATRKWTILQYSAADNNLQGFMVEDVDEMERVGSDQDTNLVVQLDTGRRMQRLLLQQNSQPGVNSPAVEEAGSVNMSDPKTLADFIEWGIKNYPSEHVMLVLSDHGDGWKGALQDVSHGGWMSLSEIKEGLAEAQRRTGKKIDILGFDACNMAATEVAYQLRDQAAYLVASEKTEGGAGWSYDSWLATGGLQAFKQQVSSRVDSTPAELASSIVRGAAAYNDVIPTLSASDLGKMGQVKDALEEFSKAILATDTSVWRLKRVVWGTQSFEGHKDAYHLAERVANHSKIQDDRLKNAARGLMQAIDDAVIEEQHHRSQDGAHGLTIEAPIFFAPGSDYKSLELSQDTHWDEASKQLTRWWTVPRPVD